MLYGLVGLCVEVVMVNFIWIYGYIVLLWRKKNRILIVYFFCDTKVFLELFVKVDRVDGNEDDDESIYFIVLVG